MSKIEVSANDKTILAMLNVVDDDKIVAPGELGLSEQAFAQINTEGCIDLGGTATEGKRGRLIFYTLVAR